MENEIINKDKIYINGPQNFFKLKKDNKIIYIFFEHHTDIQYQQECDNLYSINIDKYLKHVFKTTDKPIDFMLETAFFTPAETNAYLDTNNNNKYFEKLRTMFIKKFENAQKNVRFHYIDIRFYTQLWLSSDIINNIVNTLNDSSLFNLMNISNNLIKLHEIYEDLLEIINNIDNNVYQYNEKTPIINNVIKKITTRYLNNTNKKNINDFFNKFCVQKIVHVMSLIKEYVAKYDEIDKTEYLNYRNQKQFLSIDGKNNDKTMKIQFHSDDYDNNLHQIIKEMQKLRLLVSDIACFFMDAYFLRRFLDKDYINNVVLYAGRFHSSTYLWFLVKFYDFEIIEYLFINDDIKPKEFEKIIKKSDDMYDIIKYVFAKNFSQCVSLKPMNFD
jgi:hypothetical protein